MGFYYLLMLAIGVMLIVAFVCKKNAFGSVKKIMFLLAGLLLVIISILLLMPGSSDVISKLLIHLFY